MNFIKLILCLLTLIIVCQLGLTQQPNKQPNIIFILADDLGSFELGSYGNTFNETPNLDKLAAEGMRFTQAYSAAPICSPARAGFITGQYPARVGITDYLTINAQKYLDPLKYFTLNEALSAGSYHTGLIGKWHLDTRFDNPMGNPEQHGFDEVIGSETKYIASGDYFYPYDKIATYTTGYDDEYLTDRQFKDAAAFIERNEKKPFFLYLSLYSVHARLEAPEKLVKKYRNKFDYKYGEGESDRVYGNKGERPQAKHKDNPYLAAMIESIDDGVGHIVETLKKKGLDENTLIIFFSDNGGEAGFANNGNLRLGKSWLYEGGIRENLIAKWPATIKPGSVSDVPVCGIDFYPTFLEMAGLRNKEGNIIDGKSILDVFKGNKRNKRKALFWHYPSETGKWAPRMSSAVRMGQYKLLYFYAEKRTELYDLSNDPSEKKNIAPSHPEIAKELKTALEKWLKDVNAEQPDINARR